MNTKVMNCKCLCGAVSMQVKVVQEVEACHCGMCRRWGGGPFLSIQCGTDVKFTGVDNIGVFDSSAWASRAFCRSCGTHLYYLFKATGSYAVSAGLFQDQDEFELKEQIFIDKKPAYYSFENQTKSLSEAEVFQKYAQIEP